MKFVSSRSSSSLNLSFCILRMNKISLSIRKSLGISENDGENFFEMSDSGPIKLMSEHEYFFKSSI